MTITPTIGIAIMMNNFFHDLSVAMFGCAIGALFLLARERQANGDSNITALLDRFERFSTKTAKWSFIFILLFGAVRSAAFKQFEYLPMAEKGQIAALIVKHILFAVLIVWGLVQLRAQRRTKQDGV